MIKEAYDAGTRYALEKLGFTYSKEEHENKAKGDPVMTGGFGALAGAGTGAMFGRNSADKPFWDKDHWGTKGSKTRETAKLKGAKKGALVGAALGTAAGLGLDELQKRYSKRVQGGYK